MKNSTKKLTVLSLTVSVAMILSYVESLIPPLMAVPGVKIGLSNIATVFALYSLGIPSAIAVSLVRVVLSALLFGNVASLIYSLSGAALALVFMCLIRRVHLFSTVGVSVVGGVAHNTGQIIAACVVLNSSAISVYLAPLIVSGTVAGILVGIASGILILRTGKYPNVK